MHVEGTTEKGASFDERRRPFPPCFRWTCASRACVRTALDVCEDQVHGGVRTSIVHRFGTVRFHASWSCFHVELRRFSSTSTHPRHLRGNGACFDHRGTPPCTCASSSFVHRPTSVRRRGGVLPSPSKQQKRDDATNLSQQHVRSCDRRGGDDRDLAGRRRDKDRSVRKGTRDRCEPKEAEGPPRACNATKHWIRRRRGGRGARARAATRTTEHASDGLEEEELGVGMIGRWKSIEGGDGGVRGGTGGGGQSRGRKAGRWILCVFRYFRNVHS